MHRQGFSPRGETTVAIRWVDQRSRSNVDRAKRRGQAPVHSVSIQGARHQSLIEKSREWNGHFEILTIQGLSS